MNVRLQDLIVRRDQNKSKPRPSARTNFTEKVRGKPIYKPDLHLELDAEAEDEAEAEPYEENIEIVEMRLQTGVF